MPYADKDRRRKMGRDSRRKCYAKNPEKFLQNQRDWRKKNPEKNRAYKRKSKTNPTVRLIENMRTRIWFALKKGEKSKKTRELLDMELKEFRIYMQGQFREGMTWENYGPVWHVDHVRPCASFDLTDPEQQKICFRWDNLQPLFAKENLLKGSKYVPS